MSVLSHRCTDHTVNWDIWKHTVEKIQRVNTSTRWNGNDKTHNLWILLDLDRWQARWFWHRIHSMIIWRKSATRKTETKEGKSWEMSTKTFQCPFDSYSTCVSYHMFYTEFYDSKIIYFRSQTCIFTAIINCGPKTGCVSFEFPVEMYFFCFHRISFFYCMCMQCSGPPSVWW